MERVDKYLQKQGCKAGFLYLAVEKAKKKSACICASTTLPAVATLEKLMRRLGNRLRVNA